MRLAILTILLASLARPQDAGAARDLASLLPRGTSIYVEVDGVSSTAVALRGASIFSPLDDEARKRIDETLADLAEIKVSRAALGVLPSLVFSTRWIVIAESGDPAALIAKLGKWRPEGPKPATAEISPFVVIADCAETIETVAALRDGKDKSLADREDFQRFRKRVPKGLLRFHLDVRKLAPPIIRFGLNKKDDIGAVLFASHLLHAMKTAKTFCGGVDAVAAGAGLSLAAEIDPMPDSRAFTESRPTQPVLTAPQGCALRLSLSRDLKRFWNERATLLSESARAPLAEFQNNLNILMGGLTVEDVFAGLGGAFDLYVARGDPAAPAGRRYPSAALVAVLADPGLKTDFLLSFQTTMGIVNTQRAQEGLPRFFQESTRHRDVLIACARILPESLPDGSDPRLQLEPSLATVNDRLILGTNRSIVASLVDRVLDGKTQARTPGEESEIFGPAAAAAVADASAYLRSQMMLKEGRTEAQAQKVLDGIMAVLSKIEHGRASLLVQGELATFDVKVDAKDLFEKAPESR